MDQLDRARILRHDQALAAHALEQIAPLKGTRVLGPPTGRAGLVSFVLEGVHAHYLVTAADQYGIALRGGHHCNQPLMKQLGLESTTRASFYFYNTMAEVDQFLAVLRQIRRFFGIN